MRAYWSRLPPKGAGVQDAESAFPFPAISDSLNYPQPRAKQSTKWAPTMEVGWYLMLENSYRCGAPPGEDLQPGKNPLQTTAEGALPGLRYQ
jgi:hypothetical protein